MRRPTRLMLTGGALLTALALVPSPVSAAPDRPVAAAAPVASVASVGAATAASFTPKAPVWHTCTNTVLKRYGAQCAMLSVPLDYAKPKGAKIKLAISRVKHTTKKYQGVMLVNPGGPGASGLVLSVYQGFVPHGAGQSYDWIGFDPRGVGASKPAVSCDPNYFGYNRPRYVPTSQAVTNAWFAKTRAYTKACAAKNGPILNHLTTIDSAKDMESIRKALGRKQINYFGFSYGTYLGQVYGTLYPKRLRRAVFDSTVDPRRVWYGANLDQDVAFDKNINIWFTWLARYDSVYHLGKTGGAVRALFYRTEEKLYTTPVKAKGGLLGGSEWTDAFLYAGYYQQSWTDLANTFSAFVNKGDVNAFEAAYLDANGYGDDNGYAVYLGVQCTDTSWPQKWSTWEKDNRRIYAKAPFETWGNAWYNEPCRHWPGAVHKPVKINGKHVKSLLMIDETLDAATPYAGSIEVRKRFPGARLIKLPGGTSHANSLNGDACVDNKIAAYLANGTLPKRKKGNQADVSCKPLPQPVPTAQTTAAGKNSSTRTDILTELRKATVVR